MRRELEPVASYLWGAREALAETRRRHLRVQELEARCTAITAKMNGMPGGGGDRHSLEQAYIALAAERELELAAIREEHRKYHEIEACIAELSKREHRTVLRLRYLRGLDWGPIQREMARDGLYYSDRHVYRFHEDGLRELLQTVWKGVLPDAVPTEAAPELLHRPADQAGET